MKKKLLSLLFAAVMLLTMLCGCVPAGASAPETRTVTDMAGREVTLPAEIDSTATFGACGVLNAFVELMGGGSKICNNMSPSFTKSAKWKM